MSSNIRTLLLQSVCAIYLFAFVGFYIQVPGLLGSNGILPASDTLVSNTESSIAEKFANNPSFVWFHSVFALSVDHFLEYLALLGVLLAAIGYIIPSCCHSITFLLLWLNYKSLCDSGPVFYSQIFDHLLLEAGFLCILLAPLCKADDRSRQTHPADNVIFWLLRWLLIRFVISVSVSRLNDADAANDWWNMNALRSYLVSVPSPIDLTWLAFQTPIWVHKFVSIVIDVTSFVGPVMYLVPIRSMRITASSIQVLLQVFAMCVLNYGFYNPLVIVLHLALLNQDTNKQNGSNLCLSIIGGLVTVLLYMLAVVFLFDLSLVNGVFVVKRAITQLQMKNYTNMYMLFVIGMASLSFIIVTVKAVLAAMRYKSPQSAPKKSKKKTSVLSSKPIVILSTVLHVFVALFIFYGSVVSIHTIVVPHAVAKPSATDLEMFNKLSKLNIIHSYEDPIKLSKTAGSVGRPEVVLEVSHSTELGPWSELVLKYKPSNANYTPLITVPFAPRLSYQFRNAARSDLKNNPWLISLVYRLLQGKTSMNEFIVGNTYKRPNFIKASLYTYQFSTNNVNNNNMWKRSRKSDYFSVFGGTEDTLLQRMLREANISYPFAADKKTDNISDKKTHENEILIAILSFVREYSMLVPSMLLIWSLFIVTFFFKMLLK